MPITIRRGRGYRTRVLFDSARFRVSRYESEAGDYWMLIVDDNEVDRVMELDGDDADELVARLEHALAGKLSLDAMDGMLLAEFGASGDAA